MIFLITAGVLALLLTSASFRHNQPHYVVILKVGCATLVVEWMLLLIPGRDFRSSYAGTEHLFWINIVSISVTSLILAWMATVALVARDPD